MKTIFTKELHHKYLTGSKYASEAKISIVIVSLPLFISRGIMQTECFCIPEKKTCSIMFNTFVHVFHFFQKRVS